MKIVGIDEQELTRHDFERPTSTTSARPSRPPRTPSGTGDMMTEQGTVYCIASV